MKNHLPAAYNKRDAIIYALGIGCVESRYTYENDEEFTAFPTIAFALTFKGNCMDVQEFPPPFYPMCSVPVNGPVLDGERMLELSRPLCGSEQLLMQSREVGNFASGSGTVAQTETVFSDVTTGEKVAHITSNAFYVGTTGIPITGTCKKLVRAIPASRSPDWIVEFSTTPNQAALYRLSGDYNPLHIDPNISEPMGYPKPILHGLCTLGASVRMISNTVGSGDAKNIRRIGCRFSKPVVPGSALRVLIWRGESKDPNLLESVSFRVTEKEKGVVVIDQAYVDFFKPLPPQPRVVAKL